VCDPEALFQMAVSDSQRLDINYLNINIGDPAADASTGNEAIKSYTKYICIYVCMYESSPHVLTPFL